jgi:hypothetical protein
MPRNPDAMLADGDSPAPTDTRSSPSSWLEFAKDAAPKVLGALGLAGFVTVVGAGITWFRLDRLELPAEEAIRVIPPDDLIGPGALAIAKFLAAGALFVLLARLIVPSGDRSPGMRRGLILLAALGGIAGMFAGEREGALQVVLAAACVVAISLVVACVIVAPLFARPSWLRWPRVLTERQQQSKSRPRWLWRVITAVRLAIAWIVTALLTIVAGGVLWWASNAWAPVFLGLALLLGGLCYWIGARTRGGEFFWFDMAVFLAAGVFGTVLTLVRTYDTPKVRPVGLLLKDDPDGLSGLFVGEDEKFIYVARTVPRPDNGKRAVEGSGRLLFVPRDRVTAMSIGDDRALYKAVANAPCRVRELQVQVLGAAERRKAVPPPCPARRDVRRPRFSITPAPTRGFRRVRRRGLAVRVFPVETGDVVVKLKRGEQTVATTGRRRVLGGRATTLATEVRKDGRASVRPGARLDLTAEFEDLANNVTKAPVRPITIR